MKVITLERLMYRSVLAAAFAGIFLGAAFWEHSWKYLVAGVIFALISVAWIDAARRRYLPKISR